MAVEATDGDLLHVVVLLGAAVVAVPLFKRLGLGSILGYLAAGLVIGPSLPIPTLFCILRNSAW